MGQDYNLITEPWIPCIMPDGTRKMFGILNVITNAHEIQEVGDNSPLFIVAMHRLILAVLHLNFGPRRIDEWKQLWHKQKFDDSIVGEYFEKWRGRFNLFDRSHPFYQCKELEGEDVPEITINALAHESSSGNNPTLFDHSNDSSPYDMTPAQAAKYLVTYQAFAVGGGVSKPFNFCHAPLVGGAVIQPYGSTLFETLMSNLVIYNDDEPIPRTGNDRPAWEKEQVFNKLKRGGNIPEGYIDYLTWQSRRVLLKAEYNGNGNLSVRSFLRLQGYSISKEVYDPQMKYLIRGKKEKALKPLRLSKDKAMWRESTALFALTNQEKNGPPVKAYKLLAGLAGPRYGVVAVGKKFMLSVCGLCNDKAKIDYWRRENIPIPHTVLENPENIAFISQALELAEEVSFNALRMATLHIARDFLSHNDASSIDRETLNRFIEVISEEESFWAHLELPFHSFIQSLDTNPDEALSKWRQELRAEAIRALARVCNLLDNVPKNYKIIVGAQNILFGSLNNLLGGGEENGKKA